MNFEELLQEFDIAHKEVGQHHHATHGWVNIDCPHCSPNSGKFRLGWNLNGQYFSCWICGHCNTLKTLVALTDLPEPKVRKLLDLEPTRLPEPYQRTKVVIPKGVGPLLPSHIGYLKERGFEDIHKLVKLWDIGGIGLAAKLAHRLFIPIKYMNKTVSWTTRSIWETTVRYISAKPDEEGMNARELLYGEDHCRHACIVCEGPLDVFRIGPGAVATLGIGFSKAQVLRISKFPLRVICFDNEKDAQKRAKELCEALVPFEGMTINTVLDSKDPGSATRKEIKQLRRFLK